MRRRASLLCTYACFAHRTRRCRPLCHSTSHLGDAGDCNPHVSSVCHRHSYCLVSTDLQRSEWTQAHDYVIVGCLSNASSPCPPHLVFDCSSHFLCSVYVLACACSSAGACLCEACMCLWVVVLSVSDMCCCLQRGFLVVALQVGCSRTCFVLVMSETSQVPFTIASRRHTQQPLLSGWKVAVCRWMSPQHCVACDVGAVI